MTTSDAGGMTANAVVAHVKRMLHDPKEPELPPNLGPVEGMGEVHAYLAELRILLEDYAKGEFSRPFKLRGVVAGRLKAFQANMNHLTWQIGQIANGDFTQRVEFLGAFSSSFNSMVTQLDEALTELRKKEEELTALTKMLEFEVEQRGAALNKLRVSEAKFKYLADHDPLTGTLNRRSFMSLAELRIDKVRTEGEHCCLALLDIDFFKRFNDTYGHLEGDNAIRHVTESSRKILRSDDCLGRYGGEEFIFIFSNADGEQGLAAAERVRKGIAETPILVGGRPRRLTVSLGVVHIDPNRADLRGVEINRLLQAATATADLALYEAKEAGRNQVKSHPLPDDLSAFVNPPNNTTIIAQKNTAESGVFSR
ncbi:MAG: diguanylate cyclase [Planctomycetota bacterium]|jgi:diguanylate cyclase (GGDEF)-like protein|nr:diguanylate cyclase [Planctomycetota bacterium]